METNCLELKKKYNELGFFKSKNFIDKIFVKKLINEINNSKNTVKYFDNKKNLRRIEKLYDKGFYLRKLNILIINHLKNILNDDFIIFKDKFNTKPPGGEGFYAHYDGIFNFIDSKNNQRNGWYEYGKVFVNVLVALDECNDENGTIEISKAHDGSFEDLLENTKKNGTPAIKKSIEDKLHFEAIDLNVGDSVIFSHTCPHRSKENFSNKSRRILYYTYSLLKNGNMYDLYFNEKSSSQNLSKALSEG